MLSTSVYKRRLSAVEDLILSKNADMAFVTPSPTFQYLTGLAYEMRERLVSLIIQPERDPILVVPSFELSEISQRTWIDDFLSWSEEKDPYRLISERLDMTNSETNILLDDSTSLGIFWKLEKALGGFNSTSSITPLIDKMRLRKSKDEIELMKKSGRVIEDAIMIAFKGAKTGMTERQLKQIVMNEIIKHGADPTFAAVQFGENSALPHAEPSNRELQEKDVVLLDCGCAIDGYNTDMTRVGVVGEPTEKQREVYDVVVKAQKTALDEIGPGLSCGSADGIARSVIESEGYGKYFTHRLGHGIGLQVHEAPYLVRGNSLKLAPGMTHSVEPGVYLPGEFGIRMEDLVHITEDGVELLTFAPRDFVVIER
ncbi:MAG: aminopeptidase P family protein [Candidatus Thorarchaeota archaeon]|nr:aminopeptidase P family protein [Candidatus Thorarchaeota archaeon]